MPPRRKAPAASQRKGVLKPSQRFITSKTGKLSKTNLHDLFSSSDVWTSLTKAQQLRALSHLKPEELFGEGHPQQLSMGKYLNYFTTPNPLSTRVSPGLDLKDEVQLSSEVYLDLTKHLEKFREHLTEGRFEARWMREGEECRRKREGGEYEGIWEVEGVGLSEEGRARVEEVRWRREERRERGEE
jgi:hypothetical protein